MSFRLVPIGDLDYLERRWTA